MNPDFFRAQWQRLIIRFGQRAMDDEFKRLCAGEVRDMSESGFQRSVDVWIGSRSHNKPPLLSEFREARMRESKQRFDNEVRGAASALDSRSPDEMRKHLRLILSKEYGGVESVSDALAVARLRARVKGEGAC